MAELRLAAEAPAAAKAAVSVVRLAPLAFLCSLLRITHLAEAHVGPGPYREIVQQSSFRTASCAGDRD